MIVLRADNRVLSENSAYSYLVDNISSNTNQITVVNTEGFATDSFILIEDFGKEVAEIFRIGSVNATTGSITLLDKTGASANTKFAHPESTKVYVLPYNQVRFYWTAAAGDITDENPTFGTGTPLSGYEDLEPATWYSSYSDELHSTGFGWFIYYNSVTTTASQESNPIPYTGFAGNTVAQVFADFDSLLKTNELRLVSLDEKFSWINEALALFRNKVNLTNNEYFVTPEISLSIVAGTSEYLLPDDFSDLVSIHNGQDSKTPIPYINVQAARSFVGGQTHHYLRNRYLGIVPTPTVSTTYKYSYRSKATTVTNVSTYLDLPDNAFYALKDFMMYRACLKFTNPMANTYYESFTNSVNHYIQAAVKRDAHLDTWGIAPWANV